MQPQRRPTAIWKTQAPQLVCGLSVEAITARDRPGRDRAEIEGGKAHISWSYRDHGRWTPMRTQAIPDALDLFQAFRSFPANIGRPYIIAPRAHDALTLAGFWTQIQNGTLTVRRPAGKKAKDPKPRFHPLVLNGVPDILGWSDGLRTYRAISIDNHCKIGLRDAAINLGMEPKLPPIESGPNQLPTWPAPLVSEICLRWYQWMIDWWVKNDCGTWGDSIGTSAWNTYRSKGIPSILKTHDYPGVTGLESQSCFGGRQAVYYGGAIGTEGGWNECADPPPYPAGPSMQEPVIRFDVRAMYPAIMRDELFPVKLLYRTNKCTVANLEACMQGGMVIAAVRIKSRRGEFPRKIHDNGVDYPGGVFDTTLSTPELKEAIRHNEIIRVYCMAQYAPGRPFAKYAHWVLGARSVQKGEENAAGEVLVKSLSVALTGRLGSRAKGWRSIEGIRAPEAWAVWKITTPDNPAGTKYRCLGGVVQEWVEETTRCGLLAACYSHLTAYGRTRMALTRAMLGPQSTVWQDTDGIMVRKSKASRMRNTGSLDSGKYGSFRTEDTINNAYMFGAKTYWFDGEWITAGIHNDWKLSGEHIARETLVANPARTARDPGAGRLLAVVRNIDLDQLRQGFTFTEDGWVRPKSTRCHESDPIDHTALPELLTS